MKTLLMARHAKSSWDQPANNDFERTLNERGEMDVGLMAAHLQQCGYVPEQIISSDAVRALATANQYKTVLKPENGLIAKHDLYLASLQDIVQVVKNIVSQDDVVMLVGHNPGMSEALNYFVLSEVEDMPTCSVGIIQFDISAWGEIAMESGKLLAFEYPKKLGMF